MPCSVSAVRHEWSSFDYRLYSFLNTVFGHCPSDNLSRISQMRASFTKNCGSNSKQRYAHTDCFSFMNINWKSSWSLCKTRLQVVHVLLKFFVVSVQFLLGLCELEVGLRQLVQALLHLFIFLLQRRLVLHQHGVAFLLVLLEIVHLGRRNNVCNDDRWLYLTTMLCLRNLDTSLRNKKVFDSFCPKYRRRYPHHYVVM